MRQRIAHVLSLTTLLGFLIAWPASAAAQTPAGEPLSVVASFSILGDLVQRVGGDAVRVTTLIGPGVDAHTYDPAPADLVVLEDADLIFENGLGFEPWLDRFFESAQPGGERVVVTAGITPRAAGEHEEHEGDAEEDHGAFDPHVWHDVANAIVIVGNIRGALVAADPANAALYEANAAAYGFEILGTALGSLSTEAGDPSARQIVQLIGEIAAAGVPAIFAENVANPDLMTSIAAEAGVILAPTLYSDALGPAGSPGATYMEMMRSNVSTIVAALRG